MDQSINYRATVDMRRSTRLLINQSQQATLRRLKDFLQNGPRVSKTAGSDTDVDPDSLISGMTSMMAPVNWRSIFAHLPDILLQMDHNILPTELSSLAVIMFIDISGFTSLCETYSNTGKTGTDQLINTLNAYIGLLVSEILAFDGDVLKFAGDAILAAWYVTSLDTMNSAVIHALECALTVQEKHGDFETSVGVVLHVKIGISAGEMTIMLLGNDEASCYLELGRSIAAVNKVEDFWKPGDVVMSPTAWIHCYQASTKHVYCADGKHVKVFEIINRSQIKPYIYSHTLQKENSESSYSSDSDDSEFSCSSGFLGGKVVSEQDKWMRQAFFQEVDFSVIERLKLYIAQPVLKKIEDRQQLEYLSEMRQITIVFINMEIAPITTQHRRTLLDQCFQSIHRNAHKVQGLVSKVSLFDKGCTFLVLFGLPGLKHESDCAHALICSDGIRNDLRDREDIPIVSIGVATGPTYCGVVGHMHRHEYTVIGPRVNVAARLMMYFPSKVTCDAETYVHSKLNKENFINLPPTRVRGMSSYETLKEFKPVTDSAAVAVDEDMIILGRDRELARLQEEVDQFAASDRWDKPHNIIFVTGEGGIGRSKMLNAVIAMCVKAKLHSVSIRLKVQDIDLTLKSISLLLATLLEFDITKIEDIPQREATISKLVSSKGMSSFLWLLNHILQVNFPIDKAETLNREHAVVDKLNELIEEILDHVVQVKGKIVFTVDDVELLDDQSWQFISIFGQQPSALLIMTLRTPIMTQNEFAYEALADPKTLRIQLAGLRPHHITALTCQSLGVNKIPLRLDNVFCKMSMGVPFWVQLMLREYVRKDIIRIVKDVAVHYDEKMISPTPKYLAQLEQEEIARELRAAASKANEKSLRNSNVFREQIEVGQGLAENLIKKIPKMCVFSPGATEEDMGVPESLKGMIQARIGRLDEDAQMVVKAASVLRNQQFLRKMLEWVIRNQINTSNRVGEACCQLASRGFFTCATKERQLAVQYVAQSLSRKRGEAHEEDPDSVSDTPMCVCSGEDKDMSNCRFLNFPSLFIRDAAYETLTEDYRRQLHLAAAHFLELQVRRCVQQNEFCDRQKLCENLFVELETDQETREEAAISSQRFSGKSVLERIRRRTLKSKERLSVSMHLSSTSIASVDSDQERSLHTILSRKRSSADRMSTRSITQLPRHSLSSISFMGERRGMMTVNSAFGSLNKKTHLDPIDPWTQVSVPGMMANLSSWKSLKSASVLYDELIFHFKRAGSVKMSVIYLLEAAAVHIVIFKHEEAYNYLHQLHQIISELRKGRNPFRGFVAQTDNWTYGDLDEAQMESLIGYVVMVVANDRKNAMVHFRRSLRLAKIKTVWWGALRVYFMLLKEKFRQKLHRVFPEQYHSRADDVRSRYLQHASECLSYIFQNQSVNQKTGRFGKCAALIQVNCAEEVNHCPLEVFTSYCCQAELGFLCGKNNERNYYMRKAVEMVPDILENVHAGNLMEISRLYWMNFLHRLKNANLQAAVDAGKLAYGYIRMMEPSNQTVENLPKLVCTLMLQARYREYVDLVNVLYQPHIEQGLQEATTDLLSRCWYIYNNFEMILSFGVQLEPITKLLHYAEKMSNIIRLFPQNKPAFFALSSNVCAWLQRTNDQYNLRRWQAKAAFYEPVQVSSALLGHLSYARQLELKLIAINRLKNTRKSIPAHKLSALAVLEKGVSRNIAVIKGQLSKNKASKPRLLHMLAYHAAVYYRAGQANDLLKEVISLSEAMGNHLEKRSAEKSYIYWNRAFEQRKIELSNRSKKKLKKDTRMSTRISTFEDGFEDDDDEAPSLPAPVGKTRRSDVFNRRVTSFRISRNYLRSMKRNSQTDTMNSSSEKNETLNNSNDTEENSSDKKPEDEKEEEEEDSHTLGRDEKRRSSSVGSDGRKSKVFFIGETPGKEYPPNAESGKKKHKWKLFDRKKNSISDNEEDDSNVEKSSSKRESFLGKKRKSDTQSKPDPNQPVGGHGRTSEIKNSADKALENTEDNLSAAADVNGSTSDVQSTDASGGFPRNLWTKFSSSSEKAFPIWTLLKEDVVEIDLLYVFPVGPAYKIT